MNKILVVEDEINIRALISVNLSIAGFEVLEAESGEMAIDICNKNSIDLIVLDVMLPGIDGFEVCRRAKAINEDICVLMLTAKAQDMDKIMGLDLGADDYMTKPFNPLELVSRIRAILRRAHKNSNEVKKNIIKFGELKIDFKSHKIFKDGVEVQLTHREFSLLQHFMNNPDRAFTRDELLNDVWGEEYYGEIKTVDVHVRRLREKIEDCPSKPKLIQTVWGHGYRFVGKED
ncbi:DNA-binding response regulator, OmpR family, contains REC and winged-helix (wHTH) domain [Clostridium collagenovorans DSM 3089]|uniref:Stage 0 sporulation protein A homolog n=1 Tax=Clostridium collagenovorans DSM 3089 TaxID=1121306 RepID=A0A1M5W7X5_9CLOT|nr:response regulator transcription factor [Clostridium collagenovorans]SHH83580.1 DNA-binding response regulator, OmpR family, contains REC and winged-helix (wHTH) domain [Clostridium collagenovorans DSM 3089]